MRATWTFVGLVLPAVAAADPIEIKGATASSYYTEQGSYEPMRIADGKQRTAWVEGEPGTGLGSWIELDLGGEQKVKKLRIWAGDWSSYNEWHHAARPKQLEVKFSDGTTQTLALKDEKLPQVFDLGGKATSTLRLKIEGSYSGTAWNDTGISELQLFTDDNATTATASSIHAEDGDGNYQADNAIDGVSDSMWCEGVAGDGTGQWLEVDLGAPRTIHQLDLLNGIASSMSLWFKANQATALKLTFSDGSTADLELGTPSFRSASYTFPEKTTSKVRITATGVKQGKEYDDRFSEVVFR